MKIIVMFIAVALIGGAAVAEESLADVAEKEKERRAEVAKEHGESLYIDNDALQEYQDAHINLTEEVEYESSAEDNLALELYEAELSGESETERIEYEAEGAVMEPVESEESRSGVSSEALGRLIAGYQSDKSDRYEGMSLSDSPADRSEDGGIHQ